jgi:hypothetical protein
MHAREGMPGNAMLPGVACARYRKWQFVARSIF